MAKHLHTGKTGEQLAAAYFEQLGFALLHRNWRSGHCEIDLIATKNGTLHFIEVKTRTNLKFGYPEAGVTPAKLRKIMKAAADFLEAFPGHKRVQYDVLAITLSPPGEPEYFYIEDVYL